MSFGGVLRFQSLPEQGERGFVSGHALPAVLPGIRIKISRLERAFSLGVAERIGDQRADERGVCPSLAAQPLGHPEQLPECQGARVDAE